VEVGAVSRFLLGVVVGLVLLTPLGSVHSETVTIVEQVEMTWEEWRRVETPLSDSLVDWDEVDRQSVCLFEFLMREGIELTVGNIVLAGDWTDMMGGACHLIGEDDD